MINTKIGLTTWAYIQKNHFQTFHYSNLTFIEFKYQISGNSHDSIG